MQILTTATAEHMAMWYRHHVPIFIPFLLRSNPLRSLPLFSFDLGPIKNTVVTVTHKCEQKGSHSSGSLSVSNVWSLKASVDLGSSICRSAVGGHWAGAAQPSLGGCRAGFTAALECFPRATRLLQALTAEQIQPRVLLDPFPSPACLRRVLNGQISWVRAEAEALGAGSCSLALKEPPFFLRRWDWVVAVACLCRICSVSYQSVSSVFFI
jgi:hypothetical protein